MRHRFRFLGTLIILLLSVQLFSGCHASYYKIPITKSRKHFRPYDSKRDRGKKRVKIKKYKSLKRTKKINAQHQN
ncbi:hypothetical protein [Marinoscillum sp.]|uniref:hypothetical protein n=1 Tax=Marinoscillum sp. TaxID=2024838 RepID=UPI003BACA56E